MFVVLNQRWVTIRKQYRYCFNCHAKKQDATYESISEVDILIKIFGVAEENINGPFVAHGVQILKIDLKPLRRAYFEIYF